MKASMKVYAEAAKLRKGDDCSAFADLALRALRDQEAEILRLREEAGRAQSFIAQRGLWSTFSGKR